jgi:hypothetical protein
MTKVFWGNAPVKPQKEGGKGQLVHRDGELFYKIENYDAMPAFLVSVVSGSDHWMYVSSHGGLTCGRGNPDNALFPYYTDDKIHDAGSTTGPKSIFLVTGSNGKHLWKPFCRDVNVYDIDRHLYKNRIGNKLIFEEINHDLGLVFSYTWCNSERFGFVKKANLRNIGTRPLTVDVLDGLRNLLPSGVTATLQAGLSTLVDAYKQSESLPGQAAAIYTMSSTLTDRAEPSEALLATVAWCSGIENPAILLSETQVEAFCAGGDCHTEDRIYGRRGAFYVNAKLQIEPVSETSWTMVADINQGPADVPALLHAIDRGLSTTTIDEDIERGSLRLLQLVGSADGCQLSSDQLSACRHFSNTLFNIMRGGVYYHGYELPARDFLEFVNTWNKSLADKFMPLIRDADQTLELSSLLGQVRQQHEPGMERLVLEYLPLIFSRRHGDPSRPWNHFSIDIRDENGADKLNYQGNWRDIFQNWEALALSYPEYAESIISKFVNATTADGYNPYRVTKSGFEWEAPEPDNPWANIGYWGDHQVNYLVKLLEISDQYHPGRMHDLLDRDIFVFADVPYRFKDYQALLTDPRNSIEYDHDWANKIEARVKQEGSDGKLARLADGSIYTVNLLEKLLIPALSKLLNFIPGGGIWMNTQRPDWNDANNALVGYGLSMVTLFYLRRYLLVLEGILARHDASHTQISSPVLGLFESIEAVLEKYSGAIDGSITPSTRKQMMDELGAIGENYREHVYKGFSGDKSTLQKDRLLAFIRLAVFCLDSSIGLARRPDGLFHAYNLIRFVDDGVVIEHLYEMLEGQVAALSSGFLNANESLELLNRLRSSAVYDSKTNSFLLYPNRELPRYRDKNVIPTQAVNEIDWIRKELAGGRTTLIVQDVNGQVHFNGRFKNVEGFRAGLEAEDGISQEDKITLCELFESVFNHHQFTGRSGAMYKYEGLGCIYWHMVSKLLLATAETIRKARQDGADPATIEQLMQQFDQVKDGLGVHKSPAEYGAFTIDPYSHSTGFSGVQQPGMTGQVKEDVISRFCELGITVSNGEVSFEPMLLSRREFLAHDQVWQFSTGGELRSEEIEGGSLTFTLCGVPVVYRLSSASSIEIHLKDVAAETLTGQSLGQHWSQSLFRRDGRIDKLFVYIPANTLRH